MSVVDVRRLRAQIHHPPERADHTGLADAPRASRSAASSYIDVIHASSRCQQTSSVSVSSRSSSAVGSVSSVFRYSRILAETPRLRHASDVAPDERREGEAAGHGRDRHAACGPTPSTSRPRAAPHRRRPRNAAPTSSWSRVTARATRFAFTRIGSAVRAASRSIAWRSSRYSSVFGRRDAGGQLLLAHVLDRRRLPQPADVVERQRLRLATAAPARPASASTRRSRARRRARDVPKVSAKMREAMSVRPSRARAALASSSCSRAHGVPVQPEEARPG